MLADPRSPPLQWEHRDIEEFFLRVDPLLAGQNVRHPAPLILNRGTDALLRKAESGAEIGERVLQPPSPQCAQQQHFRKAFFGRQFCGVLGVGVVLHMGQDDDVVLLLRRAGCRVEISHNDMGPAPQPGTVLVACIAGNDKIVRAQEFRQRRIHRAGGKDHTTGHNIPSFLQE